MKKILVLTVFSFVFYFSINSAYSIVVDTPLLNVTNINPGESFEVKANVTENSISSINDTNMTCFGPGGEEGVDSWDSFTLQNNTLTWNVISANTVEVKGIITLNTSSINGTWTCKVYARNSTGDSAFNSNNSLTVNPMVGITISETSCEFETGIPGDENKTWNCSGKQNITIVHNGNINITVRINGTDLTGKEDSSWKIGVGNITYANVTSGSPPPSSSDIKLTKEEAELISFWDRGSYPYKNANDLYCWLDYPIPLKVQVYEGTIYLIVREA
ncbi:MAG: hypothetical protein ACP5O8_02350 [Candidatus Aenigmatarchaeota archaeon]